MDERPDGRTVVLLHGLKVARRLGDHDRLGRCAAQSIAGARLVPFPEPHMEAPDRFHAALLDELVRTPGQ
jgi:hypothetical protein